MFLFGAAVILFVIVCLLLILLVIIQSDKGGGISGAIGGGLSGANSFLGTQDTANILTRGTTLFAALYMVLCVVLTLGFSRTGSSEVESGLRQRAESQQSYSPSSVLEGGLPMEQEEGVGEVPEDENALPLLPQGDSDADEQ